MSVLMVGLFVSTLLTLAAVAISNNDDGFSSV